MYIFKYLAMLMGLFTLKMFEPFRPTYFFVNLYIEDDSDFDSHYNFEADLKEGGYSSDADITGIGMLKSRNDYAFWLYLKLHIFE